MKRCMVIAGEASGDLLAAELVRALRRQLDKKTPKVNVAFFGAGGPMMQEAGVELAFDMTSHAVVGLVEVIRNYGKFRRLFQQLLELAVERKPEAIICVDFSGFNRRFAHAVRARACQEGGWRPKIIQYVSPQVWASRPGRAEKMARDFDLLLAIFPFEKAWYEKRTPGFRVEFVGHPMVERHQRFSKEQTSLQPSALPLIAVLPGSRTGELQRHLPVMREAVEKIASEVSVRWRMVLPNEALAKAGREQFGLMKGGEIRVGGLEETLKEACIAIASTGTVTLECAWFGVPTVAIYKTSWGTYQVGKRIIQVPFLAMPNLLAKKEVFPELIQNAASGERIARAALGLLTNPDRRKAIGRELQSVADSLGEAGAPERAAGAILKELDF